MGNLFTSLLNSTAALGVYQRSFQTIQNNIANVNTPGFAKQDQSLIALRFDLANGLPGGVLPGAVLTARTEFMEQAVRTAQERAGYSEERAANLGQVEPLFDVSSKFGVSAALNRFFNSFSQLAVNPNDAVSRQSVIDLAGGVTDAFHQTAIGINQAQSDAARGIGDAVTSINRLATQIAQINRQYRNNSTSTEDAGLAADMNSALEELSSLANYTLIKTGDGSVNIYLGGQRPLVIADRQYAVQADFSGPQTILRDAVGNDITGEITRGKLGAQLEVRNTTLPGYLSNLNGLAQTFADTVNGQLALGIDKTGTTPGAPLFAYTAANNAALSLTVTNITGDQIAAASAVAPGGNGNALALAGLADQPMAGAFTFTQAYGNIGAQVGRDLSFAKQDQQQTQDALAQARARRQDQQGVSLDEEATKLMQFQRAYQAVGKMIGVLNDLTDTVLNIIH